MMKYTATLFTFGLFSLFLAIVPTTFASTDTNVEVSNNGQGASTHVNVQTNTGGNTICQNGKCTTTSGGTGTSKVCVNGVCHTGDEGDIDYKSEDGNTKVNIQTNDSITTMPHITVVPTRIKDVKGAHTKAEDIKDEVVQKVQDERFHLRQFLQTELTALKKFFSLEFLFGKKE